MLLFALQESDIFEASNQETEHTQMMNNNIVQASTLFFILIFSFSCEHNDTEDVPSGPLEYDPAQHIQGTFYDISDYYEREHSWEVIIDLESGSIDTIPGTRERSHGWWGPVGVERLTDFENNRRIYLETAGHDLIIQDLSTLEKRYIGLSDPETGSTLSLPPHLDFGNHKNELFAYSRYTDKIYRIDLEQESIELIATIALTDIESITDIIFHKAPQQLIIFGLPTSTDVQEASAYAIYDLATNEIVKEANIPTTTGFVKHPNQGSIFCLTVPNQEIGFRLIEFEIKMGGLVEIARSQEDLEINYIDNHRSTIHSATNSYIVQGKASAGPNLVVGLHLIDLETGVLQVNNAIDTPNRLFKIAGE